MKKSTLAIIFASLYYPFAGSSSTYPIEFADFFEERLEQIEVVIAGEARSQSIDGLVTYESFRLNNNEDNVAVFVAYLKKLRLTDAAIDKVVEQLVVGVKSNPGCGGMLSLCIPQNQPDTAEFVFDFDAQQLKVFVDASMLEHRPDSAEYHSSARVSNALVNWSDLYFYADGEGNDTLNWSNKSTIGLPLGFLSVDTQYQHNEGELELYQAVYDVEVGEHRAVVGYQGRQAVTFNSTDFLNYGANYAGLGFSLGSSQNLLKGQSQAQKRIYFFAPQSAQLEVYQGERLLLNRVVSQGQQSIGYDELPSGVYNLTLVLKQGEQEILREQRQIVNTTQFLLPVNSWDYRIDVGVLNDLTVSDNPYLDNISSDERGYGRISLAYRPSETLSLASGITSNIDDAFFQTGGYWVHGSGLSAQYNIGVFASGSQSHYGQASFGPLSSSYRYVDSDENASPLTRLLYGDTGSTDWSVGVSGQMLGGTGYANYFNYQADDFQSDNISLSWSRNAFGGLFSFNTTYSMSDEQDDSWNVMLAWSISLDDNFSVRTGFYNDQMGQSYNQSTATYQHSGDFGYASSTLGIKRGRESNAEWSANVNGRSDAVGYSAYSYVNSEGQRSLSGSLSGTQILSSQGGAMTYENGRAFVSIEPNLVEQVVSDDAPIDVTYNALKDGKYWYKDSATVEQKKLIKLSEYSDITFELDADADNMDIEDGEFHQFVMPGSYHQVKSKVIPLKSQVFLLDDMFGEPISSVRCLGDGCKSVDTLSDDGVVRVNYRADEPFKLVSAKRLCVYNPGLIGALHIQAYCLPGLDDLDNNIVWEDRLDLISQSEAERALLYIGKYESTTEASRILLRLKEVGLLTKAVEIDNSMYVYVRYLEQYTTAQRVLLDSLDTYVVIDSININKLFSVR